MGVRRQTSNTTIKFVPLTYILENNNINGARDKINTWQRKRVQKERVAVEN